MSNLSDYPQPSVTVDLVIFTIAADDLKVLLSRFSESGHSPAALLESTNHSTLPPHANFRKRSASPESTSNNSIPSAHRNETRAVA